MPEDENDKSKQDPGARDEEITPDLPVTPSPRHPVSPSPRLPIPTPLSLSMELWRSLTIQQIW